MCCDYGKQMKIKTFLVQFNRVGYETGTAEIKAKSLKKAREIADEMDAGDIFDWKPIDGEMSVEAIAEVRRRSR